MSQLLARIMLAVFMLPCAAVLYTVTYMVAYELRIGWRYFYDRQVVWIFAGIICWLFTMCYWWLLWRKSVPWTPARRGLTMVSVWLSLLAGAIATCAIWKIEDDFAMWVGTVVCPLTWLIMTTFIWRETPQERSDRAAGVSALTCPTCGYNLTGLQSTRCPECGTQFTLDELVSLQKGAKEAELG